MDLTNSSSAQAAFDSMFPRIQAFLNDTLCNEDVDDTLYVEGSTKIDFYAAPLRQEARLDIEEHHPIPKLQRRHDFEEALFERLLQPRRFNLLVLLGGLGAGKSTTVKYLLRRFDERRKLVMDRFICTCTGCFRQPIYLDFRSLGPERAIRLGTIVPDVFREMRLGTYGQIVTEWLLRCRNTIPYIADVDREFVVLRRLLIANDLLHYQSSEFPGLAELRDPELTLDAPLTSMTLSDEELIKLINKFAPQAAAYGARVESVAKDPDHSWDFMGLTLKFYLYRCNRSNPLNLMVLDNLDQLPTHNIEELLRQLHDLATHTGGLPLLVPLRPSSINPYGFVREILFRYHYGPNNFRMILNRLERYILTQSREDLKVPRTKMPDKPFLTEPSDSEIDALLVTAYLYARIMSSGVKHDRQPEPVARFHPDHQFLNKIDVPQGMLWSLAETSDALVGACCRYGLDLMRRFFENAYSNSRMLLRAMGAGATRETPRRIRLSYADLVTSLLRDPVGAGDTNRVANLFEPTRVTSNPEWPTLAKLRILSLLSREKRQRVRTIVQRLGLYGIPIELSIAALNSLQDKFRLLLWLSTNRPLSLDDASSLSQDVVISEHGDRYFGRVMGDFEYVWYCATALNERKYRHGGLRFTIKLNDYKALIQRVGATEWKQIGFSRLRAGCLPDVSGVGQAMRMEVLNVLYSSLGRALLGADVAMTAYADTPSLIYQLSRLVKQICDEILFWQRRYQTAFGSNFYLSVYEKEISALQHDILELERLDSKTYAELSSHLARVQKSWLTDPRNLAIRLGHEMPDEDLVTLFAKYGRGIFPGVRDWVGNVDKQRKISVFTSDFLKTRGKLIQLLRTRLPTYSEVDHLNSYLLSDLEAVITSAAEVAATGEQALRWCVGERKILNEISDTLKENTYDVPERCTMEQMSELKLRSNNVIAAIERLARHLGVVDSEHLSHRWQGISM